MADKVIKAVCGFSNESSAVKEELKQAAKQRGIELLCISRYRKEGIRQYITENPDCNTVILQETLQISSPYTADDLILLADERNINIIIALNRRHYGNKFMRTLYVAGITNALYEEDAYAKNIIDLMINGRSRKESRQYYGIQSIQDLEKEFEIIDEDQLNNYIDYITTGGPANEIINRYEFVAKSLKKIENNYMMSQLSEDVKKLLQESPIFAENLIIGKKKKKGFLGWRKKKEKKEDSKKFKENIEKIEDIVTDNGIEESIAQDEDFNKQLYEEVDNNENEQEQVDFGEQSEKSQDLIFEDISDLFSDDQSVVNREEKEEKDRTQSDQIWSEEPEAGLVDYADKTIQEDTRTGIRKDEKEQIQESKQVNGLKIYAMVGVMVILSFIVIGSVLLNVRKVNTSKDAGQIQVREGDGSIYETEPVHEEVETDSKKELETPEQTQPPESEPLLESETPEETETETETDEEVAEVRESDHPSTASAENEFVSSDVPVDNSDSNQTSNSQQYDNVESDNNTTTYVVNNQPQSQNNGNASTINDSSTEPDSPQSPDYQGRIYSGSEVIRIAQDESSNGVSIYIRSRESGEGFFSGTEVSTIIDTSCSYVAMSEKSGNKLVQLSFIQQ